MSVIHSGQFITIEYLERHRILYAIWNNCASTEAYIAGIKTFASEFNKTKPAHTLWQNEQCSVVINPDLQKWTDTFLNIPAVKSGFTGKVAIICGNHVPHIISVLELFEVGDATINSGFFSEEVTALNWLLKTHKKQMLTPPTVNIKHVLNRQTEITFRIDSEELNRYLFYMNRFLKCRLFDRSYVEKFATLSERECEILALVVQGFTNEEMAIKLFVSVHTIKTHRRNIMQKLECRNLQELMKFSMFSRCS